VAVIAGVVAVDPYPYQMIVGLKEGKYSKRKVSG